MVIAESTYCKQESMGRTSKVSSEPSLSGIKGHKLVAQTTLLETGKADKGRGYQDSKTAIAHHS